MTKERRVQIGRDWLYFYLSANAGALLDEGFRLFPDDATRAGEHYASRLEKELTPVIAPLTVDVEPWTGPHVGGPVPLPMELVWLAGIAHDAIGDVVNLAAFAVLAKAAVERVRAATGVQPHVSEGFAAILAADAICDETGAIDLTLAFVTPLRRPLRNLDELEPSWDGYMVGYRSEGRLLIAHASATGDVTVTTDTSFMTTPD